jgi:LPXTG-motif cell wall-anchored protein
MLLTGIVGIIMLLSLITGTIVYRKHFFDALFFKAGLNFKNRRTTLSSLHRVIGVWSLIVNAILFFTGFWLNLPAFSTNGWNKNDYIQNNRLQTSVAAMIEKACEPGLGFTPVNVSVPMKTGEDVVIYGRFMLTDFCLYSDYASSISFNAQTGRIEKINNIGNRSLLEKIKACFYPVHTGSFASVPIRCVYVIIGFTPAILSITGFILWRRRKKLYWN